MAKINKNFQKLEKNYLFREIAKRTKEFLEKNPDAVILKLGIGNTTEPLPPAIIHGLKSGVEKLSKRETYTGYNDDHKDIKLREAILNWYKKQGVDLDVSEIFISDGAKPDTANIQSIFSLNNIVAVQNPVYPVYVDSNILSGRDKIVYMKCNEKNDFIPDPPRGKVDLLYLCNPNNPTGVVMGKKQLKKFVDYALKNKAIIIYDPAYATFMKDKELPRSIYEIKAAEKCAIEIGSFSKWAGFTGVRLGWSVVPNSLIAEDTEPGELNAMWSRRQTTMFNGASNIVQEGGLAVLSKEGLRQAQRIVDYYMGNARLIKSTLSKMGLAVYGGENAPYIWIKTPGKLTSWEFFDKLLNETHVVGTPGSGFGSEGEGYFRLSAFGHREDIKKAVKSIEENLKI